MVLPFVNLNADPEAEFRADGLTEELLVALSRVPGLRVAARTSCFAFRGAHIDVRTIGDRLRARHVVGGVGVQTARLEHVAELPAQILRDHVGPLGDQIGQRGSGDGRLPARRLDVGRIELVGQRAVRAATDQGGEVPRDGGAVG